MNLLHFCRKMISIYCFILYNCRPLFKYTGHTTKSDIPENPIVDNVSLLLNRMCDLGHLGNWEILAL